MRIEVLDKDDAVVGTALAGNQVVLDGDVWCEEGRADDQDSAMLLGGLQAGLLIVGMCGSGEYSFTAPDLSAAQQTTYVVIVSEVPHAH